MLLNAVKYMYSKVCDSLGENSLMYSKPGTLYELKTVHEITFKLVAHMYNVQCTMSCKHHKETRQGKATVTTPEDR